MELVGSLMSIGGGSKNVSFVLDAELPDAFSVTGWVMIYAATATDTGKCAALNAMVKVLCLLNAFDAQVKVA